MTHDATVAGSIRADLTPTQREDLTRLESVAVPSDLQKGQLAAIILCAGQSDRDRGQRLREKWAAVKS